MSRKVLVTAGASGIGLHIAAVFLKSGDDVFICDINPDGLKTAAAELKGVKSSVCNVTAARSKRWSPRRWMRSAVSMSS
jgi:short-subunit dehydrogenase involved in D-alanine esterification of teichoic acids